MLGALLLGVAMLSRRTRTLKAVTVRDPIPHRVLPVRLRTTHESRAKDVAPRRLGQGRAAPVHSRPRRASQALGTRGGRSRRAKSERPVPMRLRAADHDRGLHKLALRMVEGRTRSVRERAPRATHRGLQSPAWTTPSRTTASRHGAGSGRAPSRASTAACGAGQARHDTRRWHTACRTSTTSGESRPASSSTTSATRSSASIPTTSRQSRAARAPGVPRHAGQPRARQPSSTALIAVLARVTTKTTCRTRSSRLATRHPAGCGSVP